MSDERIGGEEALLHAVERLPRGSGIVFRHYSLSPPQRRLLFNAVRKVARRKALLLLLAGAEELARAWKADGFHKREVCRRAAMLCSAPVHNLREIRQAERSGADLLFLSPLFPTRSHPGAPVLGRTRFASLVRATRRPVIALGGMTHSRARSLRHLGAHGWAAIDGLMAS